MSIAGRASAVLLALGLAACAHTPAPAYQPAVANTESLQSARTGIRVGLFDAAPGAENERLRARAVSLTGGSDGLYTTYLRDAVSTELETAGRLDPSSTTVIEGTLVRNELNAGGASSADAVIAARFLVKRGDVAVYNETLTAEHEWDSSFIGMIAVPAALQNYVATVQKLLGKLFSDPSFKQATSEISGPEN